MPKYIVRMECNRILFIKVKKGAKALVTVDGRLYRNDDRFYLKDHLSSDAITIRNIDSTQIVFNKPIFTDPDMTRAITDSAKLSGSKKKIWLNFDSPKLWKYMGFGALIFAVAYGYLVVGS